MIQQATGVNLNRVERTETGGASGSSSSGSGSSGSTGGSASATGVQDSDLVRAEQLASMNRQLTTEEMIDLQNIKDRSPGVLASPELATRLVAVLPEGDLRTQMRESAQGRTLSGAGTTDPDYKDFANNPGRTRSNDVTAALTQPEESEGQLRARAIRETEQAVYDRVAHDTGDHTRAMMAASAATTGMALQTTGQIQERRSEVTNNLDEQLRGIKEKLAFIGGAQNAGYNGALVGAPMTGSSQEVLAANVSPQSNEPTV